MASRPRHADVRADLLARAAEAFARDGYVKASLAGIAAEAGYTKGAVYSGFGSKAALFAEVCAARFEDLTVRTLREVEGVLGAEDVDRDDLVRGLAEVLTDLTFGPAADVALLLHDMQAVALRDPAVAEEHRALDARRVGFLAEALEAHPRLAALGPEQLRRLSSLVLALVHALAVGHLLTPGTLDRRSAELSFTALLETVLPR